MKKLFVLTLVLVLLLSGCKGAGIGADSTGITTAQEETSATPPAEQNTKPTEKVSPTTEIKTDLTETEPDPFPATPEALYRKWNDNYQFFLFDGTRPEWDKEKELDLASLQKGSSYTWNLKTKKATLINNEPLHGLLWNTKEHLFYVTEKEPNRIIRMDYDGKMKKVIYQTKEGSVEGMWYHGTDDKGKLFVNEGNKRIISFDLSAEKRETVLEADYIGPFGYEYDYGKKAFYLWWNDEEGHIWIKDPVTGDIQETGAV